MRHIDARGKPCPEPVLMTKAAIDDGAHDVAVAVGNDVAVGNVTRFLESRGYSAQSAKGDSGGYVITGHMGIGGPAEISALKDTPVPSVSPKPLIPQKAPLHAGRGDMGILLLSRTLGSESSELGEVLMKAFLGTLTKMSGIPAVLALMNGAVLMSVSATSECDIISELEARGTRVLVCGTCTKHFGITERVGVGQISNMFEITESVFGTKKPIVMG